VVELPLRGEGWVAVNTPAARIPSHGTDMLGQRYAFDFLRADPRRRAVRYHPAGTLRTLLLGVPTRECYAWGEPVHAPLDGVVVKAVDGVPERGRVHPVRELAALLGNGLTFTPDKLPRILGNHVVIQAGTVFAAFVHLAPGSVAVAEGRSVATGDVIGRVGHTGNSTTPHLHFQLMDGADPMTAKGIACAFRAYEVWRDDTWVRVTDGIPGRTERIRLVDADTEDAKDAPAAPATGC
jgi:murein DD-endopeptidase MepM/ murein hydrolase activator NlpD